MVTQGTWWCWPSLWGCLRQTMAMLPRHCVYTRAHTRTHVHEYTQARTLRHTYAVAPSHTPYIHTHHTHMHTVLGIFAINTYATQLIGCKAILPWGKK